MKAGQRLLQCEVSETAENDHFVGKHEKIVGFLYLGATQGSQKPPRQHSVDEFFQEW